jgi:methyl-accepting chemotaxis protein
MLGFGLFMGGVFPVYSSLFFGKAAYHPLYIIGCLAAGILVGSFCYYIIKQVLKIYLQRQWETLSAVAGKKAPTFIGAEDELRSLLECYDLLMGRVLSMVENVSSLIDRIVPLYHQLSDSSMQMVEGNEEQVVKVREMHQGVERMNNAFGKVLVEIEDLSRRSDEKASIASQMSNTTDTIAENIRQYSASMLEISASIEEMAVGVREVTSNIEALAASTEQTSASIMQISSSIDHIRDNAQKTTERSEQVRTQAHEGFKAMGSTLQAMEEIETSSRESFDAIKRLSQHTAGVGSILKVITDMVEQTNLLSLNASIIAAQAGTRGRAFAVVAEEVRALANRTAASTKEIADLVKNIQLETAEVERTVATGRDKVTDGVRKTNRIFETLQKIEESSAEATQMVRQIALATNEQAAGGRLISEESEKNLSRVKHVVKALREQERASALIVKALEHMRSLSHQITTATQEQSRGNRLYLQSVLEDSDKAKTLKDTSLQQMVIGEKVVNFVREAGSLIEANAEEAKQIHKEIGSLTMMTDKLKHELEPFQGK